MLPCLLAYNVAIFFRFIHHILMVCINICCLFRAYRDFQQLRLHYLSQKQPQGYTVMVSEMPKDDANDEAMTKLFNFTSHGQVEYAATAKAVCYVMEYIHFFMTVSLCGLIDELIIYRIATQYLTLSLHLSLSYWKAADLQKAFDRREFYVHKLERALWDFKTKGNRPMHKTKALGLCGDKVDSIEFYTGKLDKYNVKYVIYLLSSESAVFSTYVYVKSNLNDLCTYDCHASIL